MITKPGDLKTKLDWALWYASVGFRVFPGVPNQKIPAINSFFKDATTDLTQVRKWWLENSEYNICVLTGYEKADGLFIGALDIDVKDGRNGFDILNEINLVGDVLPETLTQQTPSGGQHQWFLFTAEFKNSVNSVGWGIDFRGHHGYVMGAGSNLNGKTYELKTHVSELPLAPRWLEEKLKSKRYSEPRALSVVRDVNQEIAERSGLDLLKSLNPAKQGERNPRCYEAACRLKDFGLEVNGATRLIATYFKSEPLMDIEEIERTVASAYKTGQNSIGCASPEAVFTEVEMPPTEETTTDQNPKGPLELLNEEYALVAVNGSVQILRFLKGAVDHFAVDAFHQLLDNRRMLVERGDKMIMVAQSREWMRWPGRKTFDGIEFDPEQTRQGFYNKWSGFIVKPLTDEPTLKALAALELFKDHILRNICHGNKEHAAWVTGWIAHIFQKPGQKVRTALVLKGKKGTGKSSLFDLLKKILGGYMLSTAHKHRVVGNFNAQLEAKLLCVLEEAFWGGDKASESVLKDLITSPYLSIERKGKEAYDVKNLTRVAILGNEKWIVPASEDERRYAVFNLGNDNRLDQDFFGQMADDLDPQLLLKYLLDFDLSTVDVNKAPATNALLEQKENSADPVSAWWRECLDEGAIANSGLTEWPEKMIKDDVREAFGLSCVKNNIRGRLPNSTQFTLKLHEIAPSVEASRLRVAQGARTRYYLFPTLEVARKEYEDFIGHKVKWEIITDGDLNPFD